MRAKLKGEIEEQNKQLQSMVNMLVGENIELRKRIGKTERRLAELENMICNALENK